MESVLQLLADQERQINRMKITLMRASELLQHQTSEIQRLRLQLGVIHSCPECLYAGNTRASLVEFADGYAIICEQCGFAGPTDKNPAKAIHRWDTLNKPNTSADTPRQSA